MKNLCALNVSVTTREESESTKAANTEKPETGNCEVQFKHFSPRPSGEMVPNMAGGGASKQNSSQFIATYINKLPKDLQSIPM